MNTLIESFPDNLHGYTHMLTVLLPHKMIKHTSMLNIPSHTGMLTYTHEHTDTFTAGEHTHRLTHPCACAHIHSCTQYTFTQTWTHSHALTQTWSHTPKILALALGSLLLSFYQDKSHLGKQCLTLFSLSLCPNTLFQQVMSQALLQVLGPH